MKIYHLCTTLLAVALLHQANIALACNCIPPTLQSSFQNNNLVVRAHVKRQLSNRNGIRSYSATIQRIYKGCDVSESQSIVVTTPSSSAACGVILKSNTNYLLMGNATLASSVSSTNSTPSVSVGLSTNRCQFRARWNILSPGFKKRLQALAAQEPPCVVTCSFDDCGPVPSVAPCPGGGGPQVTCEYNTANKRCGWNITPCSKICDTTSDCTPKEEYCADGACRPMGYCSSIRDCFNPNNHYYVFLCTGYLDCSNNSCGVACGPDSDCPPNAPAKNCPSTCAQPNTCGANQKTCVDYNCGSCQAFCY